jgi:uncharacterized membrane protein YedE/YeeE
MVYQGIPLVNLTGCEIRSVLFGLDGRVEEWNLTVSIIVSLTSTSICTYYRPFFLRSIYSSIYYSYFNIIAVFLPIYVISYHFYIIRKSNQAREG